RKEFFPSKSAAESVKRKVAEAAEKLGVEDGDAEPAGKHNKKGKFDASEKKFPKAPEGEGDEAPPSRPNGKRRAADENPRDSKKSAPSAP
ncbi:hypothetical protein, partial [Klebsiella pneumoniae]|uniref:hypothetical protein n=1 Tax=Klebsiella pneumoniae TaxID=573 RepID=UPI003EDF603B